MIRTVSVLGALTLAVAGCAGSRTGDEPSVPPPTSTVSTSTASGTTVPDVTPPSATGSTPPSATAPTPTSTRPMSSTVLPTPTRPTAPPSEPSDRITGLWVVGTVTGGGEGPCYTVTADDGPVYTVSGAGGTLAAGDRVKVRVYQRDRPVYCGTTEAWTLLEVQPAG